MVFDVDIESFLKPVAPGRPSGEDLRYCGVYDRIREARRADDPLARGEWETEIKTPDWREVASTAQQTLSETSKDLQIAAWLMEAWVYLHGFSGLAAGLELVRRLMADFWQSLYPSIEDGDIEYRIGPLTFMNEKLPMAICQVPLCDPAATRGFGYYQWEESRLVGFGQNLDKEAKKRREALIKEGKISGEDFDAAVQTTPIAYYEGLSAQLQKCREGVHQLDETVNERFAPDPPGFTRLMEAIDACSHVAARILSEKSKSEIPPREAMEEDSVAFGQQSSGTPEHSQPVTLHAGTCRPTDAGTKPPAGHTGLWVGAQPPHPHAIGDTSMAEKALWQEVSQKMKSGRLKEAMDQLLSAAALSPSIREKNRYLLLLAKLCLKAGRADLAGPLAEDLYSQVESMQLEKWEHPAWIAEVVETLYRCLAAEEETPNDRARGLFQKLCLLNVTKAAGYRAG